MVKIVKDSALAFVLAGAVGCAPEFADRSSAVTSPRVLAVGSTPAEALPGNDVRYRILVADGGGTVTSPSVSWSYCTQPKPTNELNDVATACFEDPDIITPLGDGPTPTGTLPSNGCAQFGPDVPQPVSNSDSDSNSDSSATNTHKTQGRPTDPDSTDGYYQPLIMQVTVGDTAIPTLAETRITCGLAGGTGEQFQAYALATKLNQNPKLLGVTVANLDDADLTSDKAKQPLSLTAGAEFTLRARWPVCPTEPSCGDGLCSPGETIQLCPDDCTEPKGCGGSESFAYLDPESHDLVPRHESMRVSWFATGGSFDTDHTGRLEAEFAETTSEDTWTAPREPGPVFMWVVLRDDRGGTDWRSYRVEVR